MASTRTGAPGHAASRELLKEEGEGLWSGHGARELRRPLMAASSMPRLRSTKMDDVWLGGELRTRQNFSALVIQAMELRFARHGPKTGGGISVDKADAELHSLNDFAEGVPGKRGRGARGPGSGGVA